MVSSSTLSAISFMVLRHENLRNRVKIKILIDKVAQMSGPGLCHVLWTEQTMWNNRDDNAQREKVFGLPTYNSRLIVVLEEK
jgi:hypothetical protein